MLKVLFFSHPFPLPMDSGGKIRTGQLLRHLSRRFDITLVSTTDGHRDAAHAPGLPELCRRFHGVPQRAPRRGSAAFYLRVLRLALSRYPVTVAGDTSPALRATIDRLLGEERYDLMVCDFLQPSLNVLGLRRCPRLLFQHNVESVIVRRHYETATHPLVRLFWRQQWQKMARYEREACREFDGVVTVSEVDRRILEREFGARRVWAIPTGVDTEHFRPSRDPVEENTLIFTGAMDWLPNEDAILYFATEILEPLRALVPGVRLTVVGRNPSRRLVDRLASRPEIQVIGRVEDVRPHVARHAVFVIPLRVGGGTRIKVFEAMAMGKAVVSTRIGVEGLPVRDGEHVVLADRPADFAAATARLLKDSTDREALGRRARRYVERHASWSRAADVFAEACLAIAGR